MPKGDFGDTFAGSRLGGYKYRRHSYAAIEDMIQMKVRAGRAQDLADIEHLRRLQQTKG